MLNNGYKLGMNENVALNDYPYFEYYEATLINCSFIKKSITINLLNEKCYLDWCYQI